MFSVFLKNKHVLNTKFDVLATVRRERMINRCCRLSFTLTPRAFAFEPWKTSGLRPAARCRPWGSSFRLSLCAISLSGWKTASSKREVRRPAGRNSISTTGRSSTTFSIRWLWCLGSTAFFCFWTFCLKKDVKSDFVDSGCKRFLSRNIDRPYMRAWLFVWHADCII